ncbi:hypothetical protein FNV43_RR15733 [Rhamnella rubrinervis]|uniref:AMP-activated protein kinase glycogen-binding domain-containing protein n=1 Tax=Rhamnella rubrinervis TaxID=2594499 RepID=A0A8K0E743_9ROSA|nr:hypothetical protein FNV43_RR15733 [Rhamnella rubrinervis]
MATLYHFPRFPSIFFLDHQTLQEPSLGLGCYTLQHHPPHKNFTLRASSIKKSSRKKVKSNVELCNDIREFIAAVGFPQDHVPTMKDFSEHGRNDLANIVRRRGYKVIRELLANSTETDVDEFNVEESITEHKVAISDRQDIVTEGQDFEVNSVVGEFRSSTEVNITENSSDSLTVDQQLNSDDSSPMPKESSADSSLQEKASCYLEDHLEMVDDLDEDVSLSTNVSNVENQSRSLNTPVFNSGNQSCMPLELSTNLSMKGNDLYGLSDGNETTNSMSEDSIEKDLKSDDYTHIPLESDDGFSSEGKASHKFQDEANNFAGEVVLSTEVSSIEDYSSSSNSDPALSSEDHGSEPLGSSTKLSLEEKVANFMQNGDLDAVEGNVYGISSENATEETKKYIELENAESHGPTTQDNKDLEAETRKRENQAEINKLKLMLHQKELELTRLKEQIEKEKAVLSALQIKAESEINKTQRMISEKDAELHAAEETLSGLVEVEIEYCGDGETVEVAGSFNGWHHWIKMDLQPPSSIPESIGTRLWSTMLWLYPGTYEIKFIVDGEWKIDPQRESVTGVAYLTTFSVLKE